jgi:hypothetical protein
VSLNEEGLLYLKKGLPERQLLNLFLEKDIKEISLDEFSKLSELNKKLFFIGISYMKKNRWIAQSKATGENKIFLIAEEFPETELEKCLKKFQDNPNLDYSELSKKEKQSIDILNKRKLIKKKRKTQRLIYLTEKGKKN